MQHVSVYDDQYPQWIMHPMNGADLKPDTGLDQKPVQTVEYTVSCNIIHASL